MSCMCWSGPLGQSDASALAHWGLMHLRSTPLPCDAVAAAAKAVAAAKAAAAAAVPAVAQQPDPDVTQRRLNIFKKELKGVSPSEVCELSKKEQSMKMPHECVAAAP